MFSFCCVCARFQDPRYKHLVGGKVVVPLSGREIPIIADDYVDMEFGTGALKITPGEKHGTDRIHNDVGDLDATSVVVMCCRRPVQYRSIPGQHRC